MSGLFSSELPWRPGTFSLFAAPLLLTAALASAGPGEAQGVSVEGIDFARDIRPILSDNCFHCHGPDPATRKAGLRLDTPEGASAPLSTGGRAIVPGDPSESELLYRVAPLFEEETMPPERSGKSLTPGEIDLLTRWVEEGAVWDDHWSFQPPKLPPVPQVENHSFPDPIDAFLAEKLEAAGLDLQLEADPHTLLRRASLDLVGLPPSATERALFQGDIEAHGLDAAYGSAVERLLASPRYGVHMARVWLDVARYADTHGLHLDNRRSMWPYRDWVVESLNDNKPFDEFTIEQLAGDLLPDATLEQRIASGFNRCNPTSAEGGMIAQEYLSIYAKDRADTTATVWLGLTLACAQCHDHKFDPLSQRDYYGMYAFFNSLDEEASDRNIENPRPFVRAMDSISGAKVADMRRQADELQSRIDAPNEARDAEAMEWMGIQQAELRERWSVAIPTSATSTGGAELIIDGGSGEVIAQGPNPDVPVYEVEIEVPAGEIDGLRLDALVPPGQKLPGRAENKNFVLSYLEVESAPLDGSAPFQSVELREAVATHSQPNWPVAGLLDPSLKTGWAGLGLEGERSAMVLPAMAFGHGSGTRLRIRMHFSDVHVRHGLARFRLAVSTREGGGRPGMSTWWRAYFPTEDGANLYDRVFPPEAALASGLDVLAPVEPGKAWTPEPQLVPNRAHALEPGLGVHYLVKRLVAKEERSYQLRLGSDDGLAVWLRGEQIYENRTARAVSLDQDLVPITLMPGQNELVVKVVNTGGASGFAWRLWDGPGEDDLSAQQTLTLLTQSETGSASGDEALMTLARRAVDPEWGADLDDLTARRQSIDSFQESLPTTLVSAERPERRMARIQMRGAYDQLGDVVPPATPAILPPLPLDELNGEVPNRLALARWIASRNNPLTARVWVNRAWQHFFGRGIVATPEDFGSQGEWPSHPELLDWLAVTFMDEGWDMKATHRRIVLSQAYRQASTLTEDIAELDPDGSLISRGPRFRLDGEVLRDQALYLAGLLDESMGGPGVRPYQPDGVWFAVGYSRSNTVRYEVGPSEHQRRRSLYTFWKRTAPPPNLTTFDAPMRDTCTVRRERTNTPLQALVTLNDPTYVEAAKFVAARVLRGQAGEESGPETIAAALFEHVVGRPGAEAEVREIATLAGEMEASFAGEEGSAASLLSVGMLPLDAAASELSPDHLAAWTLAASALLNLDEVLTND